MEAEITELQKWDDHVEGGGRYFKLIVFPGERLFLEVTIDSSLIQCFNLASLTTGRWIAGFTQCERSGTPRPILNFTFENRGTSNHEFQTDVAYKIAQCHEPSAHLGWIGNTRQFLTTTIGASTIFTVGYNQEPPQPQNYRAVRIQAVWTLLSDVTDVSPVDDALRFGLDDADTYQTDKQVR